MGVIIQYPFVNPADFVYDADKIELSGGVARLKDLRPADATYYAALSATINGNWGNGGLTNTAVGGAAIVGGELDCKGITIKHIRIPAADNFAIGNSGCIRFLYRPNYSGAPSGTRYLFNATGAGNANRIAVYCSGGNVSLVIYDATGTLISSSAFGAWSPVAGVLYEIEINIDVTTGASRLFISGYLVGTITSTGTRTTAGLTDFTFGGYDGIASDGMFSKLVIFDAVQHVSAYTPTDYWLLFPETVYSTDNPTIVPLTPFIHEQIESIDITETKSGNDEIRYNVELNGKWYWYTGGAFVETTAENYNEANSLAELVAVIEGLTMLPSTSNWRAFLHSDDGSTRPTIDSAEIEYNFRGDTADSIDKCVVWGYQKDSDGQAVTDKIKVWLKSDSVKYKEFTTIRRERYEVTPSPDGYWEIELVDNEQMTPGNQRYCFLIGGKLFTKYVPNAPYRNIYELT